MIERLALQSSDNGPLGWLAIVVAGISSVVVTRGVVLGFFRKWRDPEWRRLADQWTWAGMAMGAIILLAFAFIGFLFCYATLANWLHK